MNEDDIAIGSCSPELITLLDSDDIQPGMSAGYQTCKTIYLFHPLGGKMVDRPIKMAMNEPRTVHISQAYGIEQRLRDAFEREWKALGADKHIANAARISRIYGVSAIAMLVDNQEPSSALDYRTLYKHNVTFNILDPLNTAGSIVLNQDPNAQDFQKVDGIRVAGKPYHKSRCVVQQNEDPIYLAYNSAAFGFTGRSVYQRALFPLKSFIQTMRTDDMVSVKGGLLVTKIQGPSSVVNNMMQKLSGIKRMMLKRGKTGEVLQIGANDSIESIDLSNLEKPLDSSRNHILENIAAAADMPAIILNSETFAQGFGEGTEDARSVAVYIDNIREWLEPLYDYFIRICQYRAWSIEFFNSLRADFPELKNTYSLYFSSWINNFEYRWPSSMKEPESEKVKVDEIRFKAIVSMLEVLLPQVITDDENRALLIEWAQTNANANESLFPQRLDLDIDSLKANRPQQPQGEEPGGGMML
ncbi:anti-CBASS protein Acb1 family protein [Klebsiella variicola]|uniref:anti-CBASS protein Acb1 family protein n=1 Tax=Klebsiella variicola TaxID=244366 RepID=UPI002D78AE0B|nr:anti-CBASS Acb1 family protein [Klebsiella variicola]WRP36440.1 anti-CBASS Acb1 family protein [Klebsiella variicola]